jgi:hypothetical protein
MYFYTQKHFTGFRIMITEFVNDQPSVIVQVNPVYFCITISVAMTTFSQKINILSLLFFTKITYNFKYLF